MKKSFFALTIGSLLLLALLTAQGSFFPVHVAHAASACMSAPSDMNCNGFDPTFTGCGADGIPLQSVAVGTGLVTLSYSPTCKSAWAHTTNGTVVTLQAIV